ncbi:thioredoxin-like protein [Podospora australis]|uniref:Thioredoxin-like protein n=1 Tax=Podospora australis TaxID=1536484 RepID=A0AAN6WTE9_9PEZI|nr:thioredoxin-like protein [Podospora australis]
MGTSDYIFLAVVIIFLLSQTLFKDRSPIPETSHKVHKITSSAELDALLSSTDNVVVDFYADWCPPCRTIAPIFSGLADSYGTQGRLGFAKVNVTHLNELAGRYQVSAMPTFVFFEKGVPKGIDVGDRIKGSRVSVSRGADGLVERVRGADKGALEAVVQALAAAHGISKKE